MFACAQALYKFLDVMSVFDWEQHCVSMTGRVLLASFPTCQGARRVPAPALMRSSLPCAHNPFLCRPHYSPLHPTHMLIIEQCHQAHCYSADTKRTPHGIPATNLVMI